MKVELLPDRFDIECETPDDWRSLIAHCEGCSSLHCYGPKTRHARRIKALHRVTDADFLAVAVLCCSRCSPEDYPAPGGQVFLGRFPSTEAAAVGQLCGN